MTESLQCELPKGWEVAQLGEICDVNPSKSELDIPDELVVSFVPMAAAEAGTGKPRRLGETPMERGAERIHGVSRR